MGALLAFLLVQEVEGLPPFFFALEAGATLSLIALEMLPKAYAGAVLIGPTVGAAAGAVLMLALSLFLAV